MSFSALAAPVVHARSGVGDWAVWSVEAAGGVALCTDVGGVTEVVVGDAEPPGAVSTSFARLACTAGGSVSVEAHAAPPALLVSPRGTRAAPASADGREGIELRPDERLLVLSASVLDARPTALTRELQRPCGELSCCDPAVLLRRLFHETPEGAGVVVARRPVDHEERTTQ